ncbi:MAG: BatD family protein [Phycisphaerales bacterium]|nr:BatD family protein [Phycisphaerales bacterium]MCB9862353.1 BatD family protein [Phycisphaerales bacterium]
MAQFTLCIAAFLIAAVSTFAGETSIDATPTANTGYTNEVIFVQVTVKNPTQASMPTPPQSDAYDVQYSGGSPAQMTFSTNFNGRMSQEVSYTYTFELTPLKAGRIRVGPFTWKDNRRNFQSQPFDLLIKDADTSEKLLFARVLTRRDSVYVGEPLQLALEVWVKKYSQPRLGELDATGMFNRLDFGASSFGVFADAAKSSPRYREDTLPPEMVPAAKKGARRSTGSDEKDYFVFIWEVSQAPHKPGKLDFGDIVIACNYPVRLRSPGFFRIEDAQAPRRLRATPDLPSIDVKPVPLAGRPDDYNGAIGRFTLTTQATPASVPVGDPITLTLNLQSRNAPLEGLSAPRLNAVPALTRNFEVSNESLAGEVRGNSKIFSQTIRPLREDVREVPAIPFSYFDPAVGRYETAWSDPIPLQIRPADRVAIASDDNKDSDAPSMAPLVETTDGLQANHANIDAMLADQSVSIGAGTYVLLGAMPTIYLVAAIATRRNKRLSADAGARRRSRALREARARLNNRTNESPGEILAAVLGYVADRCDAPPGSMTRREAVEWTVGQGASLEASSRLDALLQNLEAARYSGAAGIDMNQAYAEADALLSRIDSEVKR